MPSYWNAYQGPRSGLGELWTTGGIYVNGEKEAIKKTIFQRHVEQ